MGKDPSGKEAAMHKPALYTAGAVFAVVALAHVVRLFLATEIVVGGAVVPVFVSLPVAVVSGLLATWMVAAARRS